MDQLSAGDKAAPSKLNRWVDPSFTDVPGESSCPPGRRRRSQASCFQTEAKRPMKKRREASSLDPGMSSLKEDQRDRDEPWVDRYSPHSQAELAVHKKKIEEVETWIRVYSNAPQGGILLLTGPSGCGKTATVQVLSLELGIRVQEWSNPTSQEPSSSSQYGGWRNNGLSCSSQSSQFHDFLLRANKYNCLMMLGDRGMSEKKLILVEDIPNQFYRQPRNLHDVLRLYVKTSRCPLVFIVSDSLSGNRSSRLLFPRDIQEELDISIISFNPVAPTTMMKVLTRISALEAAKQSCGGRGMSNEAVLEMLCSGSSGDIRSAINSLQFSSLPDTAGGKGLMRMKGGMKAASRANLKRSSQTQEQAVGGKDASLFLFRALGKILHCKRGQAESSAAVGLPSHLSHHRREALLINPELVVEQSHMSGEFFNLYLHQNYLDFFSEVEDVDQASEYLSDADLLTADWVTRVIMGGYSSSVATRGLLHCNSRPQSAGFRPLHKPSWLLVSKNHQENCLAAQSLFTSFCLTPVCLQTQLLPYLVKLSNPMRNPAQIAFIQDVGQMPPRRVFCRFKPEALMDKESGQMEMDAEEEEEKKEEGQAGFKNGLSASQPQPTPSQLLLEEEELMIDEYMSD